ncbi:diguanylate cyclase (GGDEF) domain-containing protein [Loktanella sp. DSM 29012]|nr:diguanylate cyclase (GGDEF) domain-containing protein [Loktanella sp. DSM 29012]
MLQKLLSVMIFIARWMMPKGRVDLMLKVTLMTVFIHLFSVSAEWFLIGQIAYPFWPRLMLTAISAFPFVAMVVVSFHVAEKSRAKLRALANTDTLTSLPNRRAFIAATTAAIDAGMPGFLAILDGDCFKSINDTLGHATGDRALLAIAAQLHRLQGPQVCVARLGGDEFGILVLAENPVLQLDHIESVICAGVRFSISEGGQDLVLRMSAGAARLTPDQTVIRIMAEADWALYAAKKKGGACLVYRKQQVPGARQSAIFHEKGALRSRSAPIT